MALYAEYFTTSGKLRNIFKSKQPRSSIVFGCSVSWSDWNVTLLFRFFPKMFEMTTEKVFHADDKYVLRLLNVVIHEHQFKRKGKYYKFHFDKEAYTKPKNVRICMSSYEIMLFTCQNRQQHFAEFLFVSILGPGICKNTMLFGIFARDVDLYSLSVFYIDWADFQCTNSYLFCALHTYHCVPFTWECHGTVAYKEQTTSIYDVIGHRWILFLPPVWTQSVWRTSY